MRARLSILVLALFLGVICAGSSFAADLDDEGDQVTLTAMDTATVPSVVPQPILPPAQIADRASDDTGRELAAAIFRPPI